jgi:hypothetical protein
MFWFSCSAGCDVHNGCKIRIYVQHANLKNAAIVKKYLPTQADNLILRMNEVASINDVLDRLKTMIQWAIQNQSPLGYFPSLYYRMTAAVRDGINQGVFENGARMERLDVLFARRYFEAFDAFQAGQPCSQSWQVAFDATKDDKYTVLQHLMLGVNAHINLDLGIAAAHTRPLDAIYGLRKDFEKINDVISGLVESEQQRLSDLWLPYAWLRMLLRTEEDGWVNFSISAARMAAWKVATTVAFAQDAETERNLINQIDAGVAFLGGKIADPGFWIDKGIWMMRNFEKGTVADKIGILIGNDLQ